MHIAAHFLTKPCLIHWDLVYSWTMLMQQGQSSSFPQSDLTTRFVCCTKACFRQFRWCL